ncbi:MAG: tRNA (adenosine(37)-N6)-threonylcarbamoyltransferase complex transferase subunit TsaD [Candidatus Yanofskybacteria bacterium]|nr:tRNA (adenosine(37)-N6)-threonylcarbamoyltransferase complex transferase subunit TsaD [Candidatus Yanofskybacteria bacterium]
MKILGVETSCDETAIAVVEVKGNKIRVLSNIVSSQVKLHAKYGGVVPNLAAREHEKNLPHVFRGALKKSKLKMVDIDLIAVARGPGLSPALWRGINFAKELSEKYKKPILGVSHLEGHIYSNWLSPVGENSKFEIRNSKQTASSAEVASATKAGQISNLKTQNIFPVLNLIVSGGHTELVLMKNHGKYQIIGETLDDAVGEAFDKVARLLGLGYPGGPAIALRAEQWNVEMSKCRNIEISFPRPMINQKNYNFSYAGLKTAVLYKVRDLKNAGVKLTDKIINEICYEFQNAALDVLVYKTTKATQGYKVKSLLLSGGVSANKELRKRLAAEAEKLKVKYSQPEMEYTGDNAAMIAIAGYFKIKNKNEKVKTDWGSVEMDANLGF